MKLGDFQALVMVVLACAVVWGMSKK